jgi:hypothetical protein
MVSWRPGYRKLIPRISRKLVLALVRCPGAAGPRPLAPLQHPPGSPRSMTTADKEVTLCNRRTLTMNHAELQCSHRPKNSNCNTYNPFIRDLRPY